MFRYFTAQKMKFSIKDFFSHAVPYYWATSHILIISKSNRTSIVLRASEFLQWYTEIFVINRARYEAMGLVITC